MKPYPVNPVHPVQNFFVFCGEPMDDQQFRLLLQFLGLSWDGYRKVRKGVKKRIHRHMLELNCRHMTGYLTELEKRAEARKKCELLMTVSISRFFRDRGLWQLLRDEIIPGLMEKQEETITAWSAGCASGEEAYSLKILWEEMATPHTGPPELALWATDMNPDYLDRARKGVYPPSSLKEMPEEYISKYFEKKGGGRQYWIKEPLKRGIQWRRHNLLRETPHSRFHIIFLRNNLLTYYQKDIIQPALKRILTCLEPGGFLIIGSHETLPFKLPGLHFLQNSSYIFQRKD